MKQFNEISTPELVELLQNKNVKVIDVRPVDAYNGWKIKKEKHAGYLEEFMFRNDKLIGRNNNNCYQKDECVLIEYCIHEAMSDPSDQSMLFLIGMCRWN